MLELKCSVTSVLAFGLIYSRFGIPAELGAVRVEGVAEESPAAEAQVPVGALVVAIEFEDERVMTTSGQDLIAFVAQYRGETLVLETEEGERYSVYARKADEVPPGQGSLGIALNDMEVKFYPWWEMPFRGMWVGLTSAIEFGGLILGALGSMVKELVLFGQMPADVAGPVGIVYAAEKEGFLKGGIWPQLNFAAILSINLAIINVLPFPALDGGRAVFIIFELITKKRVNQKIEQWVNGIGFLVLIGLIVLVSFRDISRIVMDESVRAWFGRWGK
jgi:regulator of sigma E protease